MTFDGRLSPLSGGGRGRTPRGARWLKCRRPDEWGEPPERLVGVRTTPERLHVEIIGEGLAQCEWLTPSICRNKTIALRLRPLANRFWKYGEAPLHPGADIRRIVPNHFASREQGIASKFEG